MATINDVARLAKVSNATVSHVINKTRRVNPETVAMVEWAIQQLDYRPNDQARSLKTGQSRMIGVLNYCSVDAYFSEILSSIEETAHAAGYQVVLRHTEREGEDQGAAIVAWMNKNIDGLIFNSPVITTDFYELIQKLNCPCVFLHFNDSAFSGDTISSDDLAAGTEATRYLIRLGHRRIACLEGYTYQYHSAFQRRIGYENALREAGLPIRDDYIALTDYSIEEGYRQFTLLMQMPEPPTAFITYSDLLAIGAIRAASDLGLAVPNDVSVIGFDDIELASFTTPRLTTIYQDKKLIGDLAVRQILKHLQHPDLQPENIILPFRLVVRESTGPARTKP